MSRSRRGSEAWARPARPPRPRVEVLIPTAGRTAELAVTLSGLAAQDDPTFDVIVSDQSTDAAGWQAPAVQAMVRVLEAQNRGVTYLRHEERRGLAEHRQFLLDHAGADAVLFLDDDVWLEPGTLGRMLDALETLGCGFVGSAVQGLSYLDDDRPHERGEFEVVDEATPEVIRRGLPGFDRWKLHNAANLAHLAAQLDLDADAWRAYRIAWIGACVLYRRRTLVDAGGFRFWSEIPAGAVGEDVAAQWRVMETAGGVGIVPSGAVHLEAPTTIPDRPVDAFDLLFSSESGTASAGGASPGGGSGALLRDR
jgi:GT2 family glycosyltransferase